jgi:signal transduction histidine kinase
MKTIIQAISYWLIPCIIFAQKANITQTQPFKKYQHYLIATTNLDSLQKVASTQSPKINTIQYLNLHLALELGIQNNYDEAVVALEKASKNIKSIIPTEEKEIAVGRNKLLQTQYESEKREANLKSVVLEKSVVENRNKLLQSQIDLSKKQDAIKTFALESKIAQAQAQTKFLTMGLLAAVAVIIITGVLFFKLSQKNNELLILQKSREKLYMIIAHDLRSPVSTFQRYSDIITYLIKTKQFTRLETTTQHIDQTSKNLSNLLNNLLGWSLNQQGLIKNMPETIKIKDFFNNILPIYNEMANLNSLTLVEKIDDISVSIDPNKFALIVRNMLDNAIKFSEENNQVQIQARLLDNAFLLNISNISRASTISQKQEIKRLFDSEETYTIGENRSFGIGLIIVKEYAKIMDAKISFDFDINCLTIFSFKLANHQLMTFITFVAAYSLSQL